VLGLSSKHRSPLSARFVSDGKLKIVKKTDMQNQYLKDSVLRALQKNVRKEFIPSRHA